MIDLGVVIEFMGKKRTTGNNLNLEIKFDATELDTGNYYATLFISSNDPVQPMLSIPVHLLVSTPVGIEDELFIPTVYKLYHNYPNPFNPTTILRYDLPEEIKVVLKVYNILGEEVATLINDEKVAGSYEVSWDANNLGSGVYFYRIQAGSFVETKKMVLMK